MGGGRDLGGCAFEFDAFSGRAVKKGRGFSRSCRKRECGGDPNAKKKGGEDPAEGDLDANAWYDLSSGQKTHPVRQKNPMLGDYTTC